MEGYEHYDVLKNNIDLEPMKLSLNQYMEKVVNNRTGRVFKGNPWFLAFVNTESAHYQRYANIWSELHSTYYQELNVAFIDCIEHDTADLCKMYKVKSHPTFFMLNGALAYHYTGKKELDAFHEFAVNGYTSYIGDDV